MVDLSNEVFDPKNKKFLLVGEKNQLEKELKNALGDMERLPLLRKLKKVNADLAELDK